MRHRRHRTPAGPETTKLKRNGFKGIPVTSWSKGNGQTYEIVEGHYYQVPNTCAPAEAFLISAPLECSKLGTRPSRELQAAEYSST